PRLHCLRPVGGGLLPRRAFQPAGVSPRFFESEEAKKEQSTASCAGECGDGEGKADVQADVAGSEDRFHSQADRLDRIVRDAVPEPHERLSGISSTEGGGPLAGLFHFLQSSSSALSGLTPGGGLCVRR